MIELAQFIDKEDKQDQQAGRSDAPSERQNRTVRFAQAYNPDLILGSSSDVDVVRRKEHTAADQKHDILLTYERPDQWIVQASAEPTAFGSTEDPWMIVDPATCEPIRKLNASSSAEDRKAAYQAQVSMQRYDNEVIWTRVKFTLFSMMVSASFFASYNVTTFYTGVTVIVAGLLRPNFIFASFMGFLYETTNPDAAIKLVEACYMKRHEEDLIGEEETYRMLQEIIRSPELYKALSGSTLKGACDPNLDRLTTAERHKLEHLDKLERKGFDVATLKEAVLEGKQYDDLS